MYSEIPRKRFLFADFLLVILLCFLFALTNFLVIVFRCKHKKACCYFVLKWKAGKRRMKDRCWYMLQRGQVQRLVAGPCPMRAIPVLPTRLTTGAPGAWRAPPMSANQVAPASVCAS